MFAEFFYKAKTLFGAELFDHLKGWDDSLQDFNPNFCRFPMLLAVAFGIAGLVFVLYYYVLNHPRVNRWWHWVVTLITVAGVSWLYGHYVVTMDIAYGNVAPSLQPRIGGLNAMQFGFYEMGLSVIFYFVLTLTLRRWSRNCKHSPWKILIRKK